MIMTSFPFRSWILRRVSSSPTYLMRQKMSVNQTRWNFFPLIIIVVVVGCRWENERWEKSSLKKIIMKTTATKKLGKDSLTFIHRVGWFFSAVVFVIKADITLNSFSRSSSHLFSIFILPSHDWRYRRSMFFLLYALMLLGNILEEDCSDDEDIVSLFFFGGLSPDSRALS